MSQVVSFFSLLFVGCTGVSYRGSDVWSAEELVLDSYKIQGGKFSILEMGGEFFPPLDSALFEEYTEAINDEDVLEVALYHPSNHNLVKAIQTIGALIGYTVREGSILLPEIGDIQVKGLTISQAERKIQTAYKQKIDGAEVFLSLKSRRGNKVQLMGMVTSPCVVVDGKKRLFDVLAEAQVTTHANLFRSYLVREGRPLPVDMHKLVEQGDMSQNIVMRPGDQVYIAQSRSSKLMVMGEVRQVKTVDVPNGSMPLREALALAGGIPYTGNRGVIQIMRGNLVRPKIYTLSWEHIARLPSSSLLVIPGDIVYVAPTPIAQWSRFITQIFPTFIGVELFRKGGISGALVTPLPD